MTHIQLVSSDVHPRYISYLIVPPSLIASPLASLFCLLARATSQPQYRHADRRRIRLSHTPFFCDAILPFVDSFSFYNAMALVSMPTSDAARRIMDVSHAIPWDDLWKTLENFCAFVLYKLVFAPTDFQTMPEPQVLLSPPSPS